MVDPLDNTGLWLPTSLWNQMRADVQTRLPHEACGLVGGLQRHALHIYAVTNALHSPVRFRMDPNEQVRIFLELERRGWYLLAIYHSHPTGPDYPSPTDLAEAAYPEAVNLIWTLKVGQWGCRGFMIQTGHSAEIPIWVEK